MKRIPLLLALCCAGLVLAGADGCASDPNVEGAKLDLRNNDFDRALQNVNTALENNPENAEAWELKGRILQQLAQSNNALDEHTQLVTDMVEAFNTAAQYDPSLQEEITRQLRIAWVAEAQKGQNAYQQAQQQQDPSGYLDAAQYFANSALIQPDSSFSYVNQGYSYISAGQPEQAITPFEQAIELGDVEADIYYYLADLYTNQANDPNKAITLLQNAQQLYPENADIQAFLLNAYIAADRMDEAMEQYQTAVEREPNNALYRYNYGSLLLQAERYEEAVEQLLQATQLDPENANAWYNLGASYINQGVDLTDEISEIDDRIREEEDTLSDAQRQELEQQMEQLDERRRAAFQSAIEPLQQSHTITEAAGEDLTRVCGALYTAYVQTNQLEQAKEVEACAGY